MNESVRQLLSKSESELVALTKEELLAGLQTMIELVKAKTRPPTADASLSSVLGKKRPLESTVDVEASLASLRTIIPKQIKAQAQVEAQLQAGHRDVEV